MSNYIWSPDHTSVIDASKYPGARWHQQQAGADGSDPSGWFRTVTELVNGDDGGQGMVTHDVPLQGLLEEARDGATSSPGSNADILKKAGLWNLQDKNSDTYKYLNAVAKPWGGDVVNNPQAMFKALSNSYGGDPAAWDNAYNDLTAAGINPQYAEAMRTAGVQHFDSVKDAPWDYAGMMAPLAFASGGILGPVLGGGVLGAAGAGAATGGVGSLLTGGDLLQGALRGGLTGAAGASLGEALGGFSGLSDVDMGLASNPFTTDPSLADLGGNIDAATGLPTDAIGGAWTPQDMGFSSQPFTTNPSLADLGGNIDAATGLPATQVPSVPSIGVAGQAAESALGPATGTTLDPGVQPSGAVTTPITPPPEVSAVATGAGPFEPVPGSLAGPTATTLEQALATQPATQPGGLTPADLGQASQPFTTNPTVADLGGAIDPATGLPGSAAPAMPPATAMGPQQLTDANLQPTGPGQFEQINPPSITSPIPAATAATGAAAGTAADRLARILRGEGTLEDILNLGGAALPGIIGAVGANQQANSLESLAHEYMALGAPSRGRYEGSFAPGFTMASDPGYADALNQSAKATLHGLSVAGNPADSPNAWAQSLKDLNANFAYPALQQYRNQNAATGGYGAFNSAAPAAATGAINAQGNVLNALGGAAADIFNPPRTLEDILRRMRA